MPSLIDTYISAIKEKSKRRKIRAAASELYNAAQGWRQEPGRTDSRVCAQDIALAEIVGGTVSMGMRYSPLSMRLIRRMITRELSGSRCSTRRLAACPAGGYMLSAQDRRQATGAGNPGGVQHGGLWRVLFAHSPRCAGDYGARPGAAKQGQQSGHQLSDTDK